MGLRVAFHAVVDYELWIMKRPLLKPAGIIMNYELRIMN